MIESRCGLLCSSCEYRVSTGCKGCVEINNPFWGACPVKTCCEGRSLPHCGMCGDFPCEQLKGFSYDPQRGDGGARIVQCEKWREET